MGVPCEGVDINGIVRQSEQQAQRPRIGGTARRTALSPNLFQIPFPP